VLVVATLLAAIRRRSDAIGYDVADAGSVVVIAAGSYGSSSEGSSRPERPHTVWPSSFVPHVPESIARTNSLHG